MKAHPATILPVIIGTAGHVDHGKTSLVKLLTGCDTDRLKEEKLRKLSIDIGFAPCHLQGNRIVGIVDVPGHEDFIRNMVAGAASIDILLLIVAADDGVMPQTKEHLRIASLLGSPRVMAAVTKIDLVDAETAALARDEISELLAASGFPDAPVVCCSNTTFQGLQEVRNTLESLVDAVKPCINNRAFRMDVERVFTVKGYGTVATGIPRTGIAMPGDAVKLLPPDQPGTVRAVQSYKQDAQSAVAGACAAINIRDIKAEAVHRGMSLCAPDIYHATAGAIVMIRNASEITMPKRRVVRFHAGTFSCQASARLILRNTLSPGESGFAHIRLTEPCVLASGDRFILRSLNPNTTLGGGSILSAEQYRLRQSSPGLAERLDSAKQALAEGDLLGAAALTGNRPFLTPDHAERLTQSQGEHRATALARTLASGILLDLRGVYLVQARLDEITNRTLSILTRYHARSPYAWGMDPAQACRSLDIPEAAFRQFSKLLVESGRFKIKHNRLALADFEPLLSQKQMDLREQIMTVVQKSDTNPPARGDVKSALGVTEKDMKLLLRILIDEGQVTLIENFLFSHASLKALEHALQVAIAAESPLSIGTFRKASKLSRNQSVAVLEHFDKLGITQRVDGGRILVDNQ